VVLEAAGLKVQLVKLTERGLLQPSFVPPPEIRRLREFTRLRTDLVHERTRYWTFLGERYRRIARRRGKRKALAAIARSILVIIFHLLADRTARFHDLGPGWYDTYIDKQRKVRNLIRQLEALGYPIPPAPAEAAAA